MGFISAVLGLVWILIKWGVGIAVLASLGLLSALIIKDVVFNKSL